ncbi:MAG: thymidine phosphorylase, partial [Sporomusaceae bacterium]|nr:thymidine phosphorylase [Sporomusaceae bacterium]
MNFVEKILQTRNGDPLTGSDIEAMIQLFTAGKIPDYQLSAWLMAVFFRGLSREETSALTLAMARSGQMLDLSLVPGIKVDKHSTGGVADTVTLILAPLVAAAGVPVAKMSGRGLGFTGGTIDKLEAIPGFSTALSESDFVAQLHKIGIALTSQSSSIAPADGKIYALRDVTGTIESIPLIASSVMSKKIASGADRILLDVKVGQGAFMKDLAAARELAETMVEIGERLGKKTIALLTDMNQPLGTAIGNGLEVAEAIEILQGGGSRRLREAVLILGSYMLLLAEKAENLQAAQEKLSELLVSGAALAKFEEWIMAQGGHKQILLEPHKLYDTPY